MFKHLNSIKVFESKDTKPAYTQLMIEQVILNREECHDFKWISGSGTADILFKIALLSAGEGEEQFRKRLLLFLLNNCDRRSSLYGDVCMKLVSSMKYQE